MRQRLNMRNIIKKLKKNIKILVKMKKILKKNNFNLSDCIIKINFMKRICH